MARCLGELEPDGEPACWGEGVAHGLRVDKPAVAYPDHIVEEVAKMAAVVNSHSGKRRSAGRTALSFVIVNPAVSTVVSGIRT